MRDLPQKRLTVGPTDTVTLYAALMKLEPPPAPELARTAALYARHKSYSAVGKRLGLSRWAVGKRLRALSDHCNRVTGRPVDVVGAVSGRCSRPCSRAA